jgi:hypothetical protein
MLYDVVRLARTSSTLIVRGEPSGAEVLIDGRPVGWLSPVEIDVCPGLRRIDVRRGGRLLWGASVEAPEGREVPVAVSPRPNLVLAGDDAKAAELGDGPLPFNVREDDARPSSRRVTEPEGWSRIDYASDVDLVLAVVPGTTRGMPKRWYLYSPVLRIVVAVRPADFERALRERPRWEEPAWGMGVLDTVSHGALIVETRRGGPAWSAGLRAGDRVVEVGGRAVERAREVRATLAAASTTAPIGIRWIAADGETRQAELRGVASPRLAPVHEPGLDSALRAAWAAADAHGESRTASAALANLALMFSAFGRHEAAAEAWSRVSWDGRSGVGDGTRHYFLGRELEALGRETAAIDAYRRAAASDSTAFHDDGPRVAPAAADRLADLGQTTGRSR